MRDYPMDKFAPVLFWPMLRAKRARFKVAKLLLVLLYPVWFVICAPLIFVLLAVSIAMAAWDDVNEPPD